jgi:hypothetical protein
MNSTPPPYPATTPSLAHHKEPTQGAHDELDQQCSIQHSHAKASHGHSKHTPVIGYAFAVHQLALRELATNHFIGVIINKETGAVLEYRHLVKNPATKSVWETSFENEIGCLFQGIRDLKGTNTCFFIQKSEVSTNKHPMYVGRAACIILIVTARCS